VIAAQSGKIAAFGRIRPKTFSPIGENDRRQRAQNMKQAIRLNMESLKYGG